MKYFSSREFSLLKKGFALCAIAILSGCAMGTPYEEDFSQTELTTMEMGRIKIGLPAGWEPDPGGLEDEDVEAAFVNKETGGKGTVLCRSAFLTPFDTMQAIGRNHGRDAVGGENVNISGPWALGKSKYSRVFDVFEGSVTRKGQEVPITSYVGYNITTMLSNCYALVLVVAPGKYDKDFELAFSAMIASLVSK